MDQSRMFFSVREGAVRRSVWFWTFVLLATYALRTFAADWAVIVKPVAKQVPRLEIQKDGSDAPGICSGVVLNTDGILLTAAHCIPSGDPKTYSLTVNGRHAETLKVNRLLDLAIVKFHRKGEEAMALAPETPPIGTEVAVVGYGFGIEKIAVQFGRVSQSRNDETKTLWINVDLIFGDSGGAVIDSEGRLIGMSSRIYAQGPAHMAAAISVETIEDFAEPWLPKKTK
jgi:serine protease DegQ